MGTRKTTYTYIACPGRSGSTLLSFLLATHPNVSSVGELAPLRDADVDTYPCSCGAKYVECPFWRNVESILKNGKYNYSLRTSPQLLRFRVGTLYRLIYYPLSYKRVDQLRDRLFSFYQRYRGEAERVVHLSFELAQAVMTIEQTSVFVDAMKDYSRLRLLARSFAQRGDVELKVLHLVRNVAGVVSSCMRTGPSRGVRRYTRYWIRAHQNIELVSRLYLEPSQSLLLSYSDLCKDPAREMKRISSFLGVDIDYRLENIDTSRYHMIGNAMRKRLIKSIASDDRWKNELSRDDLQVIRRMAGGMSASYGMDL